MPNHGEKNAADAFGAAPTFHVISSRVMRSYLPSGSAPTA